MTTKSGARIYRGMATPLAPGACPACKRVVRLTPSGRRRLHRDTDGRDCTGSGVLVTDQAPAVEVDRDAVSEVLARPGGYARWENRGRAQPANPWSGKPHDLPKSDHQPDSESSALRPDVQDTADRCSPSTSPRRSAVIDPIGYVVVCWNQASGRPEVLDCSFAEERPDADAVAAAYRSTTEQVGRRERYAVAEVVPLEDPS